MKSHRPHDMLLHFTARNTTALLAVTNQHLQHLHNAIVKMSTDADLFTTTAIKPRHQR